MRFTYKTTIAACFSGYVVQAAIVNFAPLLFVTFQNSYGISLSQITLLATVNFCVQLTMDFLATFFVDRVGYRPCIVLSQLLSAMGLIFLAVLPGCMPPFAGLLIAVVTYAVGGGLMEVLISPIVESCPTDNKEKAMSLLHSFYCWGHVGVVLISTAFFGIFGIQHWKILSFFWAAIPIVNGLLFLKVPIAPLIKDGEKGMTAGQLCKQRIFWIFVMIMICAGVSEQAVAQWASTLAEKGLGVTKTVGDLAGPLTFAALMGTARLLHGKFADRIQLDKCMLWSTALCAGAYLLIALAPIPALSLVGCGICGFAVGILWPGTFSRATVAIPLGGTAMFALLALSGDIGCTVGSTVVGLVSDAANGNLQMGILVAGLFPAAMLLLQLRSCKKG